MSLTNASNHIIHPDVWRHFDGNNLTTFETTIIDILSGRHVDGYRTSAILCPPATTSPTAPTHWASSTPLGLPPVPVMGTAVETTGF
jgi:hypothetical protein